MSELAAIKINNDGNDAVKNAMGYCGLTGELDYIWLLTDDVDTILNAEDNDIIYVSSFQELVDEVGIRNYLEEKIYNHSTVYPDIIKGSWDSQKHRVSVLEEDKLFLKENKKRYLDSKYSSIKPMIAVYNSVHARGDFTFGEISKAVEKYKEIIVGNDVKLRKDKDSSFESQYMIREFVGQTAYFSEDIVVDGSSIFVWAPGKKAKHEVRLNKSRKTRAKRSGKVSVDKTLSYLWLMVDDTLRDTVSETIGSALNNSNLSLEISPVNKLKKTADYMGAIADAIVFINSLSKKFDYRNKESLRYGQDRYVKITFYDLCKEVEISLDALSKSKDPNENKFAKVFKKEIALAKKLKLI